MKPKTVKPSKISAASKAPKVSQTSQTIDPLFIELFSKSLSKGDRFKTRIIQAAIECIAQKGVEKLNTNTLAQDLGVVRAHIAYHFKEIEQLLLLVFQYIIAVHQSYTVQALKEARTPEDKIKAMCSGTFKWAAENPDQMSTYLSQIYYSQVSEKIRELNQQARITGINRFIAIVEESASDRGLHLKKGQAAWIAQRMSLYLTGAMINSINQATLFSPQEIEKDTVQHLLNMMK